MLPPLTPQLHGACRAFVASARRQRRYDRPIPANSHQEDPPPGEDRFVAAWGAVADVSGWMTAGQARVLWNSAAAVPPGGQVVELGSFQGRSAIVIALAADPSVGVVAVDPHAGSDRGPQEIRGFAQEGQSDNEIFHANLRAAGVDARVRHVRRFSDDAHGEVEGPVDLLYVDAAHGYGPASADIRGWGARVPLGGRMLIHDSFSSVGVTLAQARLLFISRDWLYEGRSRSLASYRRVELDGDGARANGLRQVIELGWFARNLAVKALLLAGLRPVAKLLDGGRGEWPY